MKTVKIMKTIEIMRTVEIMKTKAFMAMAALALVAAACNNDDEITDNWNGEIRLSSGLAVQQTRANNENVPDKQIAENQKIGIYVTGVEGEPETSYGYSNVSAKADGNGNFSDYSTTMYYPQSGKDVKISAYHPHNSDTNDSYDFVVATDQSELKDYAASDLLYSEEKTCARSKDAQSLTFKHKLAKVKYTLISGYGDPDLTGATVEIMTPERAVKFDRKTGAVVTASTSTKSDNVKLGTTYGAIIPAQTYTKGSKFLKVTLAKGGVLYYTIPNGADDEDLALTGGNVYTFNITVNLTGLTVKSEISAWTPISAITGTATMD